MNYPRTKLRAVCGIEKGGIDPQSFPDQLFAHYSIPAFDDGMKPVIVPGAVIRSQKVPISRGSVLVSKLNPRIPRVWIVDQEQAHARICSTEFVPFHPDTRRLSPEFLAYALRQLLASGRIAAGTHAATKSRERARADAIADLEIPLPPLKEQRQTVDLLLRAEGIVRLRREAQKKAAEIIPALFLDMFGDPATNPKGWSVRRLGDIANVVSGITKGRKVNGKPTRPVPYLRVANVQAGFLNLGEMKEIEATDAEIEDLKLQTGDVVLTEGGDYDKLGRGAQWRGEIEPCIHQNHIFRVRLRRGIAEPDYFEAYLQTAAASRYFLSIAKRTTNLASINMTQLRNLPVMFPVIESQRAFAQRMRQFRSILLQGGTATSAAEAMFNALLGKVFSPGGQFLASRRSETAAAV